MNRWAGLLLLLGGHALYGLVWGFSMDQLLAAVSWDYISAPGEHQQASVRAGVTAGAWLSLVGLWGGWPRPSVRRVGLSVIMCWTMTAAIAFGSALIAGLLFRLEMLPPLAEGLAPKARVWFCSGLTVGSKAGFWIGIVVSACVLLAGRRGSSR